MKKKLVVHEVVHEVVRNSEKSADRCPTSIVHQYHHGAKLNSNDQPQSAPWG